MNVQLIFSDPDLKFSGTVNVTVKANPEPGSVSYYVNNQYKATATDPPFAWAWNTTSVTDGSYVVKAVGVYPNGRSQESPPVTVTIANGSPSSDTTPPSVPGSFARTASTQTSITTTWSASTDSVGVTGYFVYKNNVQVASVSSSTLTYIFSNLSCGTNYTLSVAAFDAAGNVSAKSTIITPTAACTSTSPWPASYFTGPLGKNNIVPADINGALLGIWHDAGESSSGKRAAIQQRMTDCGRTFDFIGIHIGGAETVGSGGHLGSGGETWVHQQGSIPLISWVPNRVTKGSSNLNTMQEINNGLHDAQYTNAANYWKSLGFRIMLRQFWEFDGNWFPWSPRANTTANDNYPNPGCTYAEWISAWQRIVNIFKGAGATNVGFFFCPTESNSQAVARACYPGDTYVDWCGSDCYNQANPSGWTSPLHAGWVEFWELFNYTGHGSSAVCTHDYFGPQKPFVVGETNSLYDSGNSNRKANWYRNIQANAFGKPDMPYLCGVEFFDVNLVATEGFDWRVDNNQTYAQKAAIPHVDGSFDATTYQGFKDFAAQTNWNVGAVGGAT